MSKKIKYDQHYFEERQTVIWPIVKTVIFLAKSKCVNSILEVGVGTGWLLRELKKAGFKVSGCDASAIAAKKAGVKLASATNLPYRKASFDMLVAISLIEHLTKTEVDQFLKETQRVLKTNGLIFLVTPNYSSPARFIKDGKWFAYQDPTHINFYNQKSLSRLLVKHKFKNIQFTHKIPYYPKLDFLLPFNKQNLPGAINHAINYILISSPVALFRDSLWVKAENS